MRAAGQITESETLRRFFPRSRMGTFTTILVGLWLLKTFLLGPRARQLLSPGQQFSIDLLTFLLIIPAIYYSWRLFSLVRKKLLWKIRRRLVLAHIFIGAIPSVLLLIIVTVSFLLFYYQLSFYLISNQIGIHAGQLHAFSFSLLLRFIFCCVITRLIRMRPLAHIRGNCHHHQVIRRT